MNTPLSYQSFSTFMSMKFFSLSLLACVFITPCLAQQVPTPTTRKIRMSAPISSQIPVSFSVSASISGSQRGETGAYLPSGADVNPDTKSYYVGLSATITIPAEFDETALPASIGLQARRVRRQATPTGTIRVYTGEMLSLPSLQRSLSSPNVNQNSRTYFYGRSPSTPYNSVEEAEAARIENDWDVSEVMGRWELRVSPEDGPSNAVEIKIDKRGQITNNALDWVNYYQHKRDNVAADERHLWEGDSNPDKHFRHCFSFASLIYGKCGLTINSSDGTGAFAQATAADSGAGSLRFYWTPRTPPFAATDPGHIAIIGAAPSTRIDNNGRPAANDGSIGPTLRPLDEGIESGEYVPSSDPILFPQSRTLSGKYSPNSILQELDLE